MLNSEGTNEAVISDNDSRPRLLDSVKMIVMFDPATPSRFEVDGARSHIWKKGSFPHLSSFSDTTSNPPEPSAKPDCEHFPSNTKRRLPPHDLRCTITCR